MPLNLPLLRTVALSAALMFSFLARAQVGVLGITDKSYGSYADQATFVVTNEVGYSYDARLDGRPIPVGVPITTREIDYHEVQVWRTNMATLAVTNQLVRFIVHNSSRRLNGSTEDGIPSWTPYPPINSTAAEFAGGHLRLITPQDFPTGYPIPVVAWVENDQGHAVRAIGTLNASGHPGIKIKRGTGSGFLAATNAAGTLVYSPQVGPLSATKSINLQSGTTWTTISGGTLPANTSWPAGSRIYLNANVTNAAGSTLTIGAGTIVRVAPNIDFGNNGAIVINGTTNEPVVFMSAVTGQAWGGFVQHANNASFTATGAIFTGCGAVPCWFLGHDCTSSTSGIGSHRGEQALISLNGSNCNLTMTDCAAIFMNGQFSHAVGGSTKKYAITLTRFLLQRCTTGGEFTGARFEVNDSAFIELNEDLATGEGPNFIDADNDGLYIVDAPQGAHGFTNTLFGWTWDDGIDSGGSGAGQLNFQSCWFDSIFHEANSLSGTGKDSRHFGDVFINCGQGIECGYNSPTGTVNNCLLVNNLIGVRFGDNYTPPSYTYGGFQWATNSIVLNCYRDVWGFNWQDWAYRTSAMDVRSNTLTAADPVQPNNRVWNPAADAARLTPFMTTPPNAPVGIGIALWTNVSPLTNLFAGVPVRLSSFTTNVVSVGYAFLNTNGVTLATGSLAFVPGETVKKIFPSGFDIAAQNFVRVALLNATAGELTGATNTDYVGTVPAPQATCWISTNALMGYRMPEGVLVRLTAPSSLPVSVGYSYAGAPGVQASGTLSFAPGETVKWISPAGVPALPWIRMDLSNAVNASLTGITSISYTNPPTLVSFAGTNVLNINAISNGLSVLLNVAAPPAGVTVDYTFEGDGAVLTSGSLTFTQGQTVKALAAPAVNAQSFQAIRAALSNPVRAGLGSPASVLYLRTVTPFIPTNTTFIAKGANWKWFDGTNDLGTSWRSNSYSDLTWSNGCTELGFGDGDECSKIVSNAVNTCYYFRTTFTVDNPLNYTNLAFWIKEDDGAVVYINGAEVWRSTNLVAAPTLITNATLTKVSVENLVETNVLSRSVMQAGTNLIAVEMHQQAKTSSDITFNLELIGTAVAPPVLPPAPAITNPTNSQSFAEGTTIAATVTATNSYTNVALYADSVRVGQRTSAPFTFNVSGLGAGSHDFVALASDPSGVTLASSPIAIIIAAPAGVTASASFSTSDGFLLQFTAAANTSYSVLSAVAIPTNTWTKVMDITAGAARAITVTNAVNASAQRFFRIVSPAQ